MGTKLIYTCLGSRIMQVRVEHTKCDGSTAHKSYSDFPLTIHIDRLKGGGRAIFVIFMGIFWKTPRWRWHPTLTPYAKSWIHQWCRRTKVIMAPLLYFHNRKLFPAFALKASKNSGILKEDK